MKRFFIYISLFIAIPIIILIGIYLWTDPFKCIHVFDIHDIDDTNREYLSTELFLRNKQKYNYDSFIFSSSRGIGINTYTWKMYLSEEAQPFLFQAWSESITGIRLKIDYLDKNNFPINNALILIDIPKTFDNIQLPRQSLTLKHYMFTGDTKFKYNVIQFSNFIQKPSFVLRKIKGSIIGYHKEYISDTITNDFDKNNYHNYADLPKQDSLKKCSEMTKTTFLSQIEHSNHIVSQSEKLIDKKFEQQLQHIKEVFDKKGTDYYIILSPTYCYTNPAVNPYDLEILQRIFGEKRVFDYTGKNDLTDDYNNYSDPNHFGLRVGYLMLKDIYNQ